MSVSAAAQRAKQVRGGQHRGLPEDDMFGMFKRAQQERVYRDGSITVTDPEVRERIRYLGLTEEDLGVIATFEDVCRGATDHMVDEF
jgi:hypothetical protein